MTNVAEIPSALSERPRWVVWRAPSKAPLRASDPRSPASSTDPATWGTFEFAISAIEDDASLGLGFVLGDSIAGVDLDHCLSESGELHPDAAQIIAELDTYTEQSPSGTGVHALIFGDLKRPGNKTKATGWGGSFEVYSTGRYFTVTGDRLKGVPTTVTERQGALEAVHDRMIPERRPSPSTAPREAVSGSDTELIDRARSASNGAAFSNLWDGDTSGHGGDDSAADAALCSHLAYWTGGEAERIDSLFRQSGLYRDKWDEQRGAETYGQRTIRFALSNTAQPEPATTFATAKAATVQPNPPASGVFTHPRIVDMAAAMQAGSGPVPYLVRPLAVNATLTLLVGKTGSSKTWLGLAICAAVEMGGEVGGLSCEQGRALYVDAENGAHQMGRRFNLLGYGPDALTVVDGTGWQLNRSTDELRDLIIGTGATLVILDSLRRLAPAVREDKSDDVAPLMAGLAQLTRDTGCAIVAIHHQSTKANSSTVRGSSTFEDQADAVFVLERVGGDPLASTRRRLRCSKMRADTQPRSEWLTFDTVGGAMTVTDAEPFEPEPGPTKAEVVADQIRALGASTPSAGWGVAELAKAVGRRQDDKTYQDAMRALVASNEWAAKGNARARRIAPANHGSVSDPVGGTVTTTVSSSAGTRGDA